MLGVVGSNLTIFKVEPTTPNTSQRIATQWPRTHMLRYALWHVAIVWPGLKRGIASTLGEKKTSTANK